MADVPVNLSCSTSGVQSIVSQLKESIMPEIKSFVANQVHSEGKKTSRIKSFGEQSDRTFNYFAHPSGQPVEDSSSGSDESDIEVDPLKTLDNVQWNPPDSTKTALENYLRRALNKDERKSFLERFPVPCIPSARVPSLDESVQHLMTQRKMNIRGIPGALAVEAVQVRLLESVGPLSALHCAAMEAISNGQFMNPKAALEAINHALIFIGNANAQATFQRQRAVLGKINPSAISYLTKESLPADCTDLFGNRIRKSIKEAAEIRREWGFNHEKPVTSSASFRFRPKFNNRRQANGFEFRQNRYHPYDNSRGRRGFYQRPSSRGVRSYANPAQDKDTRSDTPNACQVYWTSYCNQNRSKSVQLKNKELPAKFDCNTSTQSIMGRNTILDQRGTRRTPMVASERKCLAPFSYFNRRNYTRDRIGRITERLGCLLRRSKYRGEMDDSRFVNLLPHKPVGTPSSISGSEMLYQANLFGNKTEDRQPHCGCVFEQAWRHSLYQTQSVVNGNMGMVCEIRNMDHRRIYSRNSKCGSRLGIPSPRRLQQLEIGPACFSNFDENIPLQSGHVCRQEQQSTPSLLELESRPGSSRYGCVFHVMDCSERLCFSPVLPNRSLHSEVPNGSSKHFADCPDLEKSDVVFCSSAPPDRYSSSTAQTSRSFGGSTQQSTPTFASKQDATGSMDGVRGPNSSSGLSRKTEEILSNSIRVKSRKSYDTAWRTFCSWCRERNLNSTEATVNEVLEFLTKQFEKGLAYNTINLYRSALSYYLPHRNGMSIGSDRTISRFIKGVFHMRTPQPRYTATWDPSVLVNFIQQMGTNSNLTLTNLSKKLVCLLALTKACRSSDVCTLDLQGLSFTYEGVIFKRFHLSKTSRRGFLPDSFFPKYDEVPNLCVVSVLKEYIARTSKYRNSSKLILTTVKPYRPVSTNTVSRWILDFMRLSGIDISVFKAHSIRSSATSKASQRGMSLHDIQKSADWSSPHTFLKFYNRHFTHSDFGTTVLSSNSEVQLEI